MGAQLYRDMGEEEECDHIHVFGSAEPYVIDNLVKMQKTLMLSL